MKIIIFIIASIAAFLLIPENWISDVLMSHISIAGDGEEAMNDYEFTLLIIKLGLSLVTAFLVVGCYWLLKR